MAGTKRANRAVSAECACCARRVYRMHGLVVLVRYGDTGIALRLACVGYCAEHRAEAIDAAVEQFRGRGRVVGVSPPDLVRPNRQAQWRRAATARLSSAGHDLLGSADLVGEPQPYPTEPVPSTPADAADAPAVDDAPERVDSAAWPTTSSWPTASGS